MTLKMKHSFNTRYAVKRSQQAYASIVSEHKTLGKAYKKLVSLHRSLYKHNKFPLAQEVIAIIATEADADTIRKDIQEWRYYSVGPRSKRRLPLPIVVHQWNPKSNLYLRYGEMV